MCVCVSVSACVCVCMCMCLCVCVCVHVVCVCEMSCHIAVPTYVQDHLFTYVLYHYPRACVHGREESDHSSIAVDR